MKVKGLVILAVFVLVVWIAYSRYIAPKVSA